MTYWVLVLVVLGWDVGVGANTGKLFDSYQSCEAYRVENLDELMKFGVADGQTYLYRCQKFVDEMGA